jgi:acetyl-CoA carboxylase carboxyltransferase component
MLIAESFLLRYILLVHSQRISHMPESHNLEELRQRLAKAEAMGGTERIVRQHKKGRLTARERIHMLLDENSFDELGVLAHSDLPEAAKDTAADGKITAYGEINQRPVFVSADDATVMAGAGGRVGYNKQFNGAVYAAKKGYPIIHLGDGGGARIPDIMGSTGMMSMAYPVQGEARSRRVPQIASIMGECYGGPSWTAAVSDVVIQVKGSIMSVAGPAILEIATGEKSSPEALGGWELHAYQTGQVDIFAEDEVDCLWKIRDVLSYLPSNADELPPIYSSQETQHSIPAMTAVPDDPKAIYDMHQLLELIADNNSLLEFKPYYDGSLITALGRLDGRSVGFLANNPLVNVGAMGAGACEKATAFIAFCDSFHIPLIFLHDTPGFFVGKEAEEAKMPLRIMSFIQALQYSTVPRIGLIVRKSYGMAHCNMVGGNMGADSLLAWPTAEVSFMDPRVAVNVVYGRKLQQMDNPEAAREQYIEQMRQGNAIWDAAGMNYVDKVIEPNESRRELIRALNRAAGADGKRGWSKRHLANWPRMF